MLLRLPDQRDQPDIDARFFGLDLSCLDGRVSGAALQLLNFALEFRFNRFQFRFGVALTLLRLRKLTWRWL